MRSTGADGLIAELIGSHATSVLAVARRYSLCADDAHDAYQRGMEILIRRAGSLEPSTASAWLKTVVKHEAMAIRSERMRQMPGEDVGADIPAVGADPEARRESFESLEAAAEALEQLKPNEAKAIILKAQGLSYSEIGARQGWTYTKVNRLLSEGRSAMRERFASIESGRECQRLEPLIHRYVDGEAPASERRAVWVHLRHCRSCRKLLVAERRSVESLSGIAPVGLVAVASGATRPWDALVAWLGDRSLGGVSRLQAAVDVASAGKVAAVAATAAVVAGGGAAAKGLVKDVHSHGSRGSGAQLMKSTGRADASGSSSGSSGLSPGRPERHRGRPEPPQKRQQATATGVGEFEGASTEQGSSGAEAASLASYPDQPASGGSAMTTNAPAGAAGAPGGGEFGP